MRIRMSWDLTRGLMPGAEVARVILVATHISTNETRRFELDQGEYRLGRASTEDSSDKLAVDFDPRLSRRTALLEVGIGAVRVRRDGSRYPLFHEGEEKDTFQLLPGQRFSSAETVFELLSQTAQTLTVQALNQTRRDNAEEILQVLLRLQTLLSRWHEPVELAEKTVALLMELLPGARVAFFRLDEDGEPYPLCSSTLRPSRGLMAESLTQGLPVFHCWQAAADHTQPTQFSGEHWALVAPVHHSEDRLILYALGFDSHNTPGELQRGALALVAQILGQHLEGRRAIALAAKVEAEQRANLKLRILLTTLERSLSLQGDGVEATFLDGVKRLTGAEEVRFHKDLARWLEEADPDLLAVAFEHYHPKGVLCRKEGGFAEDDREWVTALLGFAETVFENRRLHHQVRSALQELKRSQNQQIRSSQWVATGRLAANAAHELNTPLGAIKLAVETAQTFSKDGPKPVTEGLKLIGRSVDRCRRVTERLLVYSKPREEKVIESISLEEVVQDSLSTLGPYLRIRPVEIEWQPADCSITGDLQDCYWAVTNVLKNAFEAVADQPVRRVKLSLQFTDSWVTLLVEDSGPGLNAEIQEQLFEPFITTKKIGEGNGLGLAISRRNLRNTGGDLELRHSSLGGAAFALKFPRGDRSDLSIPDRG